MKQFNEGDIVFCAFCNVYNHHPQHRKVRYQGADNRVWVERYDERDNNCWFYVKETFYSYEDCKAYCDAYKAEQNRVNALSDEDWVLEEAKAYLSRYFDSEIVNEYLEKIKALPDYGNVELKIRDGVVYYTRWYPANPCRPPASNTRHRETKAEKEARLIKQAEDRQKDFEERYRVL